MRRNLRIVTVSVLTIYSLYIIAQINVDMRHPSVIKEALSWSDLNEEVQNVEKGGYFIPVEDIEPVQKLALLIPVRNRDEHLRMFLRHIHPFLQNQNLEYKVYVVNQTGDEPFNKGAVYNVAVIQALKDRDDWECLILHDVDLLPEDARNLYQCSIQPKHMSVAIDKFNYTLPYRTLFGGVVAITPWHYRLVDGFSNRFWAWGGEDDDFYRRVRSKGLIVMRDSIKVTTYQAIPHEKSERNSKRWRTMREGREHWRVSGLTTKDFIYSLVSVAEEPLFTHIIVEFHDMFKKYNKSIGSII